MGTKQENDLWGALRTLLRDAQTATAIQDDTAYLDCAAHTAVEKAKELLGVAALTAEVVRLKQAVEEARREGKRKALNSIVSEMRRRRAEARVSIDHDAERVLSEVIEFVEKRRVAAPAASAQPCDHPAWYRSGSANGSGDIVETCGKCGKVLVDVHLDVKPMDTVARNGSAQPPAGDVEQAARLALYWMEFKAADKSGMEFARKTAADVLKNALGGKPPAVDVEGLARYLYIEGHLETEREATSIARSVADYLAKGGRA